MKLCYIGRVPTNCWPRRLLCALWTRRPIVKVAMGCHTDPAALHIAHVLQRLHFFQSFNFFYNLHHLPQKKLHALTAKKITRLDDFFVHDLHFSLNYTLQCEPPHYRGMPPSRPMTAKACGQAKCVARLGRAHTCLLTAMQHGWCCYQRLLAGPSIRGAHTSSRRVLKVCRAFVLLAPRIGHNACARVRLAGVFCG